MQNQPNKQDDIRVIKTRRTLAAALFYLLEQKVFSKITVNDIRAQALVSRTTFYAHFEDKYALLRFALEQMREQMRIETTDPKQRIIDMLTAVEKKSGVLKNLMAGDENHELHNMLSEVFAHNTKDLIAKKQSASAVPEMLAVFCAGGAANLLGWWLRAGFQPPKEQIADFLINAVTQSRCETC